MFDELRKGSKVFIWIVAAAFVGLIFIAWGADFQLFNGGPGNAPQNLANEAGRVNGEPISRNDYVMTVNRTIQGMAAQNGQQVDEQTRVLIQNQAWQSLVQQSLLRKAARESGVEVRDPEVVYALMNQPPAEFQQIPQLQRDGRFDLGLYQAMLRDPAFDTRGLEQQYRQNLPIDKLQQQVMATAVVSDLDLWTQFRLQNEKIRASYLMVPAGNFTVNESGIEESALQKYFDTHKETYRTSEEAVVRWVQLSKAPSADDSLAAYELASSLLGDHRAGDDFLSLMDSSEAPANQRGGATATWISPNTLVPAVRSVVQALPVGQVSDIIIEPRGFHVVRVEEVREDETAGRQIKIADLFIPLAASSETLQTTFETMRDLRQNAGGSLEKAAEDHGLTATLSRPFGRTGFVPGLGNAPEVQDFAFRNAVGAISPPIERAGDWIIVEVVERREPRIPELSEVMERVRRETAEEIRREQAVAYAERLLARVRAGESMESIAASDSLVTHDTTDEITRLAASRGIGNDPELIGPLFAAETGLIDRVLNGRRGGFVIRVESKTSADRTAFEASKAQLRQSLAQNRQGTALRGWLEDLAEGAEVRDFRLGSF